MPVLPDLEQATFNDPSHVDNAFFPLPPGTINSYGVEVVDPENGEEESERNDHFATFETKTIAGVEALVVRDTAYEGGILVEDTLDWYAQDDDGNVWYMGEIATNYIYDDEGEFIGTDFDGSWQAGVDCALAGWIMRADPKPGDSYFQEFYPGVAVDQGKVIATGLSVDTAYASFDDVIKFATRRASSPASVRSSTLRPASVRSWKRSSRRTSPACSSRSRTSGWSTSRRPSIRRTWPSPEMARKRSSPSSERTRAAMTPSVPTPSIR